VSAAQRGSGRELRPTQLLVSLALLLLVVVSALAVVDSTHRSRERFNDLQKLQREEWALDEEWERLLLEQSTWAAHERVNQIAESKLDMVMPDPAVIKVMPSERGKP
jgi:cell division protein FtsL